MEKYNNFFLGHGPYSHVFDSMVTPNLLEGANKTWKVCVCFYESL